jgi:DNA-binding transcriptional MerR regulator
MTKMQTGIQIGKVAEQTGLSADTIRFYQRIGLLPQPARSAGGFRLFTEKEIRHLLFVQHAQELGFALAEIKQLAVMNQEPDHACPQVRELIKSKLKDLRKKSAQILRLQKELNTALRTCNRRLRTDVGHAHRECCPVLKTLEQPGKTGRPRRARFQS